jgi:hypothetical protein
MQKLAAVLLAQRGDMVLYDGDEGPALGLVCLNGREAMFVRSRRCVASRFVNAAPPGAFNRNASARLSELTSGLPTNWNKSDQGAFLDTLPKPNSNVLISLVNLECR